MTVDPEVRRKQNREAQARRRAKGVPHTREPVWGDAPRWYAEPDTDAYPHWADDNERLVEIALDLRASGADDGQVLRVVKEQTRRWRAEGRRP